MVWTMADDLSERSDTEAKYRSYLDDNNISSNVEDSGRSMLEEEGESEHFGEWLPFSFIFC